MRRWFGLLPLLLLLAGCGSRPYVVALNPLHPNWEIEESLLDGQRVHIVLHMKPYYAGGSGEARALFNQRAKELVRINGFDGYQVLEYAERMDSTILGSQRGAEGVVVLTRKVD